MFTNYIQPICLPNYEQNVFNINGVVAGYGSTGPNEYDQPFTEIPLFTALKSVTSVDCFHSNLISSKVLSERSFCAGSNLGIPCRGLQSF